ncbi:MAG: tail fiber domain-containing protein [bacterium]|nr:tail fiber domain-containing protein [bacterium]
MKHVKTTSKAVPAKAVDPACERCVEKKSKFMDEYDALSKCVDKGDCASPSDRRLKRGILGLRGALGKLLRLRGVTFEYNEAGQERGCPAGKRTGMIAQDVEEVFPEWVRMRKDGYRELAIHGFEALTVEALRELKAENDALCEELAELRSLVREREEAECVLS